MKEVVRRSCRRRLALVFFGFLAVAAYGQTAAAPAAYGEIVYAEGREFAVVRGDASRTYRPATDDVIGLRVQSGDLIQTGAYSFVEIQLVPQGAVLKLAENSSFYFQGIGGAGESISLGLVYGRVRAKVARLAGAERFAIRSGATVAGVRGTDFGVDAVVAGPSAGAAASQPTVQVYCFEGTVSVTPQAAPEDEFGEASPQVAVAADQLLVVDSAGPLPLVERRAVDPAINAYWRENSFKGETPLPAPPSAPIAGTAPVAEPVPAVPAAAPGVPAPVSEPAAAPEPEPSAAAPAAPAAVDFSPYIRAFEAKNGFVKAAVFLGGAGFVLQGVSVYSGYLGLEETGKHYGLAGAVCSGLAVTSLLFSYFVRLPE